MATGKGRKHERVSAGITGGDRMITNQHFADTDDSEIKSERQMQLKTQYLQGFKDGVMGQREFCMNVLDKIRAEIEPKCDRINSLASALPYTAHREIQELLCEIMDLCKTEREGEE